MYLELGKADEEGTESLCEQEMRLTGNTTENSGISSFSLVFFLNCWSLTNMLVIQPLPAW
jgi:hypothetical protein